jgi:hypothetical protein
MPAPLLSDFLAQHVERYHLEDIAAMSRTQPAPVSGGGACGYPLIMTVCSGVELLGALSSPTPFNTRSGSTYFLQYWRAHVYQGDPGREEAGEGLYQLARHGLAHAFVMKGSIHVIKRDAGSHLRLTAAGDLYVDSAQLADDFVSSYHHRFKPQYAGSTTAQARLGEMWSEYVKQADGEPPGTGYMKHFRNLPPPLARQTTTTTAAPLQQYSVTTLPAAPAKPPATTSPPLTAPVTQSLVKK